MRGISSGWYLRVVSHQGGIYEWYLIRVVSKSGISSGWYLRGISSGWYLRVVSRQGGI